MTKLPLFAQDKDGKWVLLPAHKFKYFPDGSIGIPNDDIRRNPEMEALLDRLADLFTVTPTNWSGTDETMFYVKSTLPADRIAKFQKAIETCTANGQNCVVCSRFKLRK